MDKYFLIVRGEDVPYVCLYSKAQLEKALIEEYSDYTDFSGKDTFDFEYFPSNTYFIIKGQRVHPKAVSIVTKLEVE